MNNDKRSFYIAVLISIVCILKACAEGIPDSNINYYNEEQPVQMTGYAPAVDTPVLTDDEAQVKRDTAKSEGTTRSYPGTFLDLLQRVYTECIEEGSFTCVKPKFLSFLSSSVNQDNIRITRDLSIVRKDGTFEPNPEYYQQMAARVAMNRADDERRNAVRLMMLDRVDDFLDTHELRMRVPKELLSGEMLPFVPKFLLNNIPEEIRVPLTTSSEVGRRKKNKDFLKKFVIPFLLGLKFKLTALVPLALAMIALKTWKALTLGLLSLVLSGAMVIFKFSKPKLVSYELLHYPQHHHSHVDHHDYHHGYGRSTDAQQLAYNAYNQN